MTKKQTIAALRQVAKYYDIRASFTKTLKGVGGFSMSWNRVIIIDTNNRLDRLVSAFFHEIAHIHNYDGKKFWVYHQLSYRNKYPTGFFQTALRAEMYTDKIGKRLQAIHFPGTKYVDGYKKTDGKFLAQYYRGE